MTIVQDSKTNDNADWMRMRMRMISIQSYCASSDFLNAVFHSFIVLWMILFSSSSSSFSTSSSSWRDTLVEVLAAITAILSYISWKEGEEDGTLTRETTTATGNQNSTSNKRRFVMAATICTGLSMIGVSSVVSNTFQPLSIHLVQCYYVWSLFLISYGQSYLPFSTKTALTLYFTFTTTIASKIFSKTMSSIPTTNTDTIAAVTMRSVMILPSLFSTCCVHVLLHYLTDMMMTSKPQASLSTRSMERKDTNGVKLTTTTFTTKLQMIQQVQSKLNSILQVRLAALILLGGLVYHVTSEILIGTTSYMHNYHQSHPFQVPMTWKAEICIVVVWSAVCVMIGITHTQLVQSIDEDTKALFGIESEGKDEQEQDQLSKSSRRGCGHSTRRRMGNNSNDDDVQMRNNKNNNVLWKESLETLAHELRTPLQAVMGMTSLVLDDNADEQNAAGCGGGGKATTIDEYKETMGIVMTSSRLLLTLIDNAIDIRKCDANIMDNCNCDDDDNNDNSNDGGRAKFVLRTQSLAPLMTEASNVCKPLASITNVRIELSMDPKTDTVHVRLNEKRFQQIVVNLVSNAIKYAPDGSRIQLHTKVMTYQDVVKRMESALAIGLPLPVSNNEDNNKRITNNSISQQVVVVSICDSGKGVAVKEASQMFCGVNTSTHRNHQSNLPTNNHNTTLAGMGLNFCVEFIKRMHGNIWVSNCCSGDGGACFAFYIPVVQQHDDDHRHHADNQKNMHDGIEQNQHLACDTITEDSPATTTRAGLHASPSSVTQFSTTPPQQSSANQGEVMGLRRNTRSFVNRMSDLKVMLVDDTALNLKVLDRMLKRVGVQSTAAVDSGPKALGILEEKSYDLIITDIQMPEMTGIELCDAIRRDPKITKKPVVVGLTAGTSDTLRQQCAESGMPHVLHKPITVRQIQYFFVEIFLGLERCDEYNAPKRIT